MPHVVYSARKQGREVGRGHGGADKGAGVMGRSVPLNK